MFGFKGKSAPEQHLEKIRPELEREDKERHLSPQERVELVQKYLTPEGKELFAELCIKFLTPIVLRIIGDKYYESVEDVVQVATFDATRFLNKFKGESTLQTWLFRIGTNASFYFLRRTKTRKDITHGDSLEDLHSQGEDIADPSAPDTARESADMLADLMEVVDEHQKHILILRYVEGYSIKEISEMLGGINENTLKVQLFRAKALMVKHAQKRGLKIVEK